MSPEKYAQERYGMPSLKYMASLLDLTQKYLKQTYRENPKAFDVFCQQAHHAENTRNFVQLMKAGVIQAA